jgi:hypothetical protein
MAVSLAGQAVVEPPPPTQPKKKMMKWSFRSVIIRTNVTETFVILCCGHVTYKASSPAGHIERDSFILLKNIFYFIYFLFGYSAGRPALFCELGFFGLRLDISFITGAYVWFAAGPIAASKKSM